MTMNILICPLLTFCIPAAQWPLRVLYGILVLFLAWKEAWCQSKSSSISVSFSTREFSLSLFDVFSEGWARKKQKEKCGIDISNKRRNGNSTIQVTICQWQANSRLIILNIVLVSKLRSAFAGNKNTPSHHSLENWRPIFCFSAEIAMLSRANLGEQRKHLTTKTVALRVSSVAHSGKKPQSSKKNSNVIWKK